MQNQIIKNKSKNQINVIITPDGVGGYSQRFCIGAVSKSDIDKVVNECKSV